MNIRIRVLLQISALMLSPLAHAGSFETYHPDQTYRDRAAEAYDAGNYAQSLEHFQRAARYGDKPSQLAVAMLLWNGEGASADHALAYAWADLAAERGWPSFVAVRERFWNELDATERERAASAGKVLYAEYGDAVAKPRLNALLRRGLVQKTGSHLGGSASDVGVAGIDPSARAAMTAAIFSNSAGNMKTYINDRPEPPAYTAQRLARLLVVAMRSLQPYAGGDYYSDVNWKPNVYWKSQDALWRDVPVGNVTVGSPRIKDDAQKPAQP